MIGPTSNTYGVSWQIQIPDDPSAEDREAVVSPLANFNAQSGYPVDSKPIAVLLKDGSGATVGGLWGKTTYGWLFVEFLVVPENLRGRNLGAALMTSAENVAKERGCIGSWLTTFTFQARSFYEKLGYSVFGKIENSPADNERIFLKKRF